MFRFWFNTIIVDMKTNNQVIKEALKVYMMEASADFPVLLTGPWGCGKTYLIKELIKQVKAEGEEVLYISLNGVASVEEIERRIVEAFCGDVSRTWMFKALRLGNGIAELIKGCGADLTGALSGINAFFKEREQGKARKQAVVFDDLERCELPLRQRMGYLEAFVEQTQKPVVYIGNEEKLFVDQEYTSLKEKFVGKTYTLVREPEDVIPILMDNKALSFQEKERVLAFSVSLMNKIYDQLGHFNYRAFKAALWQLKQWQKSLGQEIFRPKRLELHFTCLFLLLAYAAQLGILKNIGSIGEKKTEATSSEKKFTWEDLCSLCTQFDFEMFGSFLSFNWLLSSESWTTVIDGCSFHVETIREELRQSVYYRQDYAWEPLFRAWAKDDGETRKARRKVLIALQEHKITDSAEIRLVFELLRKYDKRRYDALKLIRPSLLAHFLPAWEDHLQHLARRFEDYVSSVREQLVFSEDGTWNDSFAGFSISEEKDDWYQHNLELVENLAQKQYETKVKEQITDCLCKENLIGLCQFLMSEKIRNRPVVLLDDDACAQFAALLLKASVEDSLVFQEMVRERYFVRVQNWQEWLPKLIQEADSWKTILEKMKQNRVAIYHQKGQWKQPNRIALVETTINTIRTSLVQRFNTILSSRKTNEEPNEMMNTTE